MAISTYFVSIVALFNVGGLVADAIVLADAKHHLSIRVRPPHAEFHFGQTKPRGIISGVVSLDRPFGARPMTLTGFLVAAAVAANYVIAMRFAPSFLAPPGAIPSSRSTCHVQ